MRVVSTPAEGVAWEEPTATMTEHIPDSRPLTRRWRPRVAACAALLLPALFLGGTAGGAQQTPPVEPRVQDTPLPPPVELPTPPEVDESVANRPITAAEAVRIALQRHENVTVAESGVAAAQGRIRAARSGLLPTVNTSGGYTRSERVSTGSGGGLSGTTGFQASVNLNQLLYDANHTRDLVRQAQAQEISAGENLERVQADLALQVKQAFYTYAQNRQLVLLQESNLQNRQEHVRMAQARLRTGIGLPLDVVRAETAVAQAVLDLTVARTNESTARVNLALLMGLDPRTPLEIAESEEPAMDVADLNALVDTALAQRPEVGQANASLEAARFALAAAKTLDAPSVSASVGLSARGNSMPPRNDALSVGAQVQWSPFDGGLRRGRQAEASAGVTAAQAQVENAQRLVTAEVSQSYLTLRAAEQRVVAAEAGIANAEESLRLATGRYQAELGSFLDVLDAQAALTAARTQRITALTAVSQARAALARAVGQSVP